MRIESKHLFSENISPFVKSLVMKRRAGIQLTEREERRLEKESKKMNDSVVSMVEPTKYHNRLSPTNHLKKTFGSELPTDELEDEIDLDEILKEMGYDEDEMDITQLSKSELKELIRTEVQNYFEDTFENPDDLTEISDEEIQSIIDNLTQ